MRRFFWGLGGIIGGLILLLALAAGGRPEALSLLGWAGLSLAAPFEAVFETPRRLAELAASRAQWAADLTAVETIKQLRAENEALRAQLKLAQPSSPTLLAGRFVYAERSFLAQNLLVQLEEAASAVKTGQAVIAPGNILIGKVDHSQDRFVWAKLVTDAALALSVISGEQRARGVIKGDGQGGLSMRLTAGAPLPVLGELVFTDTLDPDVPPALLVGTVEALPKEAAAPDRVVSVKPAFQGLSWPLVFIVTAW